MSEPFIALARQRIEAVRRIAEKSPLPARSAILNLIPVVEALIDAVESDGSLPGSLCTAVVKYGTKS